MEARRNTWEATIRLAVTSSLLAAMAAVVLYTVGLRSQPVIVMSVIVVCFAASWVRTAQPAVAHAPRRPVQRTVVVPVRGAHPVS